MSYLLPFASTLLLSVAPQNLCTQATNQVLSALEIPNQYEIVQSDRTRNSFIGVFYIDSSHPRAQVLFNSPLMVTASKSLIDNCGYESVEFYGVQYENGQPLPVDNFIMPGAFTIQNGAIVRQSICSDMSGHQSYCN